MHSSSLLLIVVLKDLPKQDVNAKRSHSGNTRNAPLMVAPLFRNPTPKLLVRLKASLGSLHDSSPSLAP